MISSDGGGRGTEAFIKTFIPPRLLRCLLISLTASSFEQPGCRSARLSTAYFSPSLPSSPLQAHMGCHRRRSLRQDAPPTGTQVSRTPNGDNPRRIPSIEWMEGISEGWWMEKKGGGGGDRWRMCSGDICGSLYLIPPLSLRLGPSELSAAGGELHG